MSFWDDEKFKKDKSNWYQILKATGFSDVEDEEQNYLKQWDSNFFRNNFNQIKYETSLQYYRAGRDLLRTYPFQDESHRLIWEMHIEGISERKIAESIKGHKKSSVHKIIAKISSRIKTNE